MVAEQRFRSNVVRTKSKTYVPIPFDPNDVWGEKDRHYVKGSVGGCRIRGVLRIEETGYALPLGPAWLRDNALAESRPVDVVLEPDGPQSEAMADDIAQALDASPNARVFFQSVAPFYRKNFLRWIDQAKRAETRQARIAEMVKMLEAGQLR
jgi:uncharacterized protein YdeI (YjbR/CyaY-like superfamily)